MNTVKRLRLKVILSRDRSRNYYTGRDIRADDLEKKNRTGSLLITGRNLLDLAVKGSKYYKKAVAFNTHKWDSSKMEPKESGDSLEDCIEYVRRKFIWTILSQTTIMMKNQKQTLKVKM